MLFEMFRPILHFTHKEKDEMQKLISMVLLLSLLVAIPAFAQDSTATPDDIPAEATATLEPTTEPVVEPTDDEDDTMTEPTVVPTALATPEAETTIADFIGNSFVVLNDAVQAAGLAETLSSGDYTVFAPTDGAFQTLLNDLEISRDDLMANPALLEGVLTYHVIPGRFTLEELRMGVPVDAEATAEVSEEDGEDMAQEPAGTATAHGASLSFGFDPDVSRVIINGGEASVEQGDIVLSNGIVHVIDNVLLPPNASELMADPMPEATQEALDTSAMGFIDENMLVLSAAIDAAGLRETINEGEFTIFAPTNGAFQTALNELGISQDALLADVELLNSVLPYHVIPGIITSDDILNGSPDTTTVQGSALSFGFDDDVSRVVINGGEASIEQADIYVSNGIIHIIDNVLLPPQ